MGNPEAVKDGGHKRVTPLLRSVANASLLMQELVAMQNEKALTSESISIPLHFLDHLSVIVLAIDIQNFEIIYMNEHARELFGDIHGTKCWRTLQKVQSGHCLFCSDRRLTDPSDDSPFPHYREAQNVITKRWYAITDMTHREKNGRLVKIHIAEDITKERQQKEQERQGHTDSPVDPADMIMMCCNCRKIRNDKGEWKQPSADRQRHFGATVSHGLCKECVRRLFSEVDE